MKESTPKAIRLADYRPPLYLMDKVSLNFNIVDDHQTLVEATMGLKRNEVYKSDGDGGPLELNGVGLKLLKVELDGKLLSASQYRLSDDKLIIPEVPEQFELKTQVSIDPAANTALEGLYKSGNIYCTQNEPEGMRHITYFIDRPDVMAVYTTRIEACKEKYPVLLSNGNPIEGGDLDSGRHYKVWEDPFPKPCYLFALVAGDLGLVEDQFITMSKRKIPLQIFCDKGNESKCHHAMDSLKRAMKWDEEKYGLEYDLDLYMIVAVDAFNMGAMENKGLNIFNTSCVLADAQSATDDDHRRIEGVVAHEYFHNWTGNRITCRDWFQLTLKEGLTVYRDQEFSGDMASKSVQRISDVWALRSAQFPEDQGPAAHPIRPPSYIEINNFYTSTVYNKGAEVIRMVERLLGREGFRKGMDKYFELYDGQAVTTEDFVYAMEQANEVDLGQFQQWYHQSGTPEVVVSYQFERESKLLKIKLQQKFSADPEGRPRRPLTIPLEVGLVDEQGNDLPFQIESARSDGLDRIPKLLIFDQKEASFELKGVEGQKSPVLSVNRGFTAPIKINIPQHQRKDLSHLWAYDQDDFNRWEAGLELAFQVMGEMLKALETESFEVDGCPEVRHHQKFAAKMPLSEDYRESFGKLLSNDQLHQSFKAQALTLPTENLMIDRFGAKFCDPIYWVRRTVQGQLGLSFREPLIEQYQKLHQQQSSGKLDFHQLASLRDLKNTYLAYLTFGCLLEDSPVVEEILSQQYFQAREMTDQYSALSLLLIKGGELAKSALDHFYQQWKGDILVMNKWFSVQASTCEWGGLEVVKKLETDPIFNSKIPNLVRSLFLRFTYNNIHFHRKDGSGYDFIAQKVIELDALNPQVAATLASRFQLYSQLDEGRQQKMAPAIEKIIKCPTLSPNTFEMISKTKAKAKATK